MLRYVNFLLRKPKLTIKPMLLAQKLAYSPMSRSFMSRRYGYSDSIGPDETKATDETENEPSDSGTSPDVEDAAPDHGDTDDNQRSIPLLGGGLEKLQGGLMEENYFNSQNKEIIRKLHENGTKIRDHPAKKEEEPEKTPDEWMEFEKARSTTKWSDNSSLGRQKNPREEKFFLEEQVETLKQLSERIKDDKPEDAEKDPQQQASEISQEKPDRSKETAQSHIPITPENESVDQLVRPLDVHNEDEANLYETPSESEVTEEIHQHPKDPGQGPDHAKPNKPIEF